MLRIRFCNISSFIKCIPLTTLLYAFLGTCQLRHILARNAHPITRVFSVSKLSYSEKLNFLRYILYVSIQSATSRLSAQRETSLYFKLSLQSITNSRWADTLNYYSKKLTHIQLILNTINCLSHNVTCYILFALKVCR